MKTILITLSIILCTSGTFAQENDDMYYLHSKDKKQDKSNTVKNEFKSIPKGTWKIIIKNNKTRQDNYQFIGETLINENFQINNANKDFYTISTVPKEDERLNFNYILNFVAKDSCIVITGTFKINASLYIYWVELKNDYDKIENKGQNGSPIKEAFKELYQFGLKLSNGNEMAFISDDQPPANSTPKNITEF